MIVPPVSARNRSTRRSAVDVPAGPLTCSGRSDATMSQTRRAEAAHAQSAARPRVGRGAAVGAIPRDFRRAHVVLARARRRPRLVQRAGKDLGDAVARAQLKDRDVRRPVEFEHRLVIRIAMQRDLERRRVGDGCPDHRGRLGPGGRRPSRDGAREQCTPERTTDRTSDPWRNASRDDDKPIVTTPGPWRRTGPMATTAGSGSIRSRPHSPVAKA